MDRGCNQERFYTHVQKARDGRGGVVRMDARKNQVAGQSSLDRDLGSLKITDLTHEDDVGILPEERAESRRESEADLFFDLNLIYSAEVVLDRILGGDNVGLGGVQPVQSRVQSGGLPASRRAGLQNNAVGFDTSFLDA